MEIAVDTVVIIVKYFKKKLRVHKAINNTELFTISLMLMNDSKNESRIEPLIYPANAVVYH